MMILKATLLKIKVGLFKSHTSIMKTKMLSSGDEEVREPASQPASLPGKVEIMFTKTTVFSREMPQPPR